MSVMTMSIGEFGGVAFLVLCGLLALGWFLTTTGILRW